MTAAPPTALTTVLLDIDGTLLDSNEAHAQSWAATLREHGHAVEADQVRPLIGMGTDQLLQELIGLAPDDPAVQRLADARRERFLRLHLPTLAPTPGARALVLRLHEAGLQAVIATSAGGEELQALLERAEVADLVDETTSASDAQASKPAPDIVQAALRKAGAAPEQALMLGDTRYDIAAARGAGVDTIAVRCGGSGDDVLAGAIAVYDHPQALLADWARSPLAQRGAGAAKR